VCGPACTVSQLLDPPALPLLHSELNNCSKATCSDGVDDEEEEEEDVADDDL